MLISMLAIVRTIEVPFQFLGARWMLPLLEDCPNDSGTLPFPWSLVDATIVGGLSER